jgi:uncharacterized phage-associated protein
MKTRVSNIILLFANMFVSKAQQDSLCSLYLNTLLRTCRLCLLTQVLLTKMIEAWNTSPITKNSVTSLFAESFAEDLRHYSVWFFAKSFTGRSAKETNYNFDI